MGGADAFLSSAAAAATVAAAFSSLCTFSRRPPITRSCCLRASAVFLEDAAMLSLVPASASFMADTSAGSASADILLFPLRLRDLELALEMVELIDAFIWRGA